MTTGKEIGQRCRTVDVRMSNRRAIVANPVLCLLWRQATGFPLARARLNAARPFRKGADRGGRPRF
uniref:Uncharacterized protein n=1 Tax=Burkholderia cenocepacia TaxID=95486 RepID=A0A071MEG7_9BURK